MEVAGSARERTPWRAVQQAAWAALTEPEELFGMSWAMSHHDRRMTAATAGHDQPRKHVSGSMIASIHARTAVRPA